MKTLEMITYLLENFTTFSNIVILNEDDKTPKEAVLYFISHMTYLGLWKMDCGIHKNTLNIWI